MSGSEGNTGTVDVETLARLLMCSTMWIGRLVREGYIPKQARGRYPLAASVQGYLRYLVDPERRRPEREVASRKSDARTREIELRIADRERGLVSRESAEAAMDMVVAMVGEVMRTMPARVTRDPAARAGIEASLRECLSEVAATLADARVALASGRLETVSEGAVP